MTQFIGCGLNGATGAIDIFSVTLEGQTQPVQLYIDMHDEGPVEVPVGFTVRSGH